MESTSLHAGHKLAIVATTDSHEAATGADVCLEIDGKVFNAVSVELHTGAGSKIVEATVKFPVNDLTVAVTALTEVIFTDGSRTQVRDITLQSPPSTSPTEPLVLMGFDVDSAISTTKNDLVMHETYDDVVEDKAFRGAVKDIYIKAEAGRTVKAKINCDLPVELL